MNEFHLRLADFLEEGRRLSGRDLIPETGSRFINLTYLDHNKYIYAKVELTTGDVYSESGKKPRGNILTGPYYGKELIDEWGVIVNRVKAQKRLLELQ